MLRNVGMPRNAEYSKMLDAKKSLPKCFSLTNQHPLPCDYLS
jgi:hypothetical protein